MTERSSPSRARRLATLTVVLFCAVGTTPVPAELPPPSTSPPVFADRPFGPRPAPTPPQPSVVRSQTAEPIPRSWIVGGMALGALVAGALLFFALRAWRMARIFGRQYRFPVPTHVAVRFGGERSGGLLATTRFGTAGAASKPEDA